MSLSITSPISTSQFESLSPDQAATLYKSLSASRSQLYELGRSLRTNPLKALNDPKMRRLLALLKKLPGPKGLLGQIATLRRGLTGTLHTLQQRMNPQGKLPEAGSQKYGANVGADIERILRDPSLSLEEKLMMLSSTLAAKLENEIEAKMEEWAKLSSGSQGSGSSQMIQGLAGIGGNLLLPGVGGILASQAAGQLLGGSQATSQDDTNMKGKQLETQIQLLMQKLNRMTTMVSTLMQDDHKTKSSVIANMRV